MADVANELGAAPAMKQEGVALSDRAGRIVSAIAEAAIPKGDVLDIPSGPICVERVRWFLAGAPRMAAVGYVLMLWLFELGALLVHGQLFSALALEKRTRYLGRWHHARGFAFRATLRALLTPVKLGYFADREVAQRIGYSEPRHPPKRPLTDALQGQVLNGHGPLEPTLRCEVVVIGSGAGGAVVAKELAERGRDVLLLEEGVFHASRTFSGPAFERSMRLYRDSSLTVALGKPGIPIPLGKTVGGTTTINSGTCFRVPEKTLAKWRDRFGLPFTAEALAPHYERVESFIEVAPVSDEGLGRNGHLVRQGAAALGLNGKPLQRNAASCQGSGACCFGCPTDAKRSMNVSYVPAALEKGARLATGFKVERILTTDGKATGVLGRTAYGQEIVVEAQAVVLAAGTLYSPYLLKKSRLTGRSGQVGRNLSIHPAAKVNAYFEEEVVGWRGVPQGLWIDDLVEKGIVFEGVAMPPDFGAVGFPGFGPEFVQVMEKYRHISSFGFLVEDSSQGRVYAGADGRPLVLYNVGEAELAKIREGIEVLCRVYFAAGAKVVYPPLSSVPELHSVEELSKLPARIDPGDVELTAFHPLGTCRLGNDPLTSVIDPDLEHHDVEKLFVVDGSIFPSSLGRNPQLTIMAFATRQAEIVDRRLGGAPRAK